MECYEQVTQLIYDAIAQVNETLEPEQALESSPDTVLVGESGKLDSMGFVNLIAALEQNIERNFSEEVNLIDVIVAAENSELTVATLAKSIAELIEQRRAQLSARG